MPYCGQRPVSFSHFHICQFPHYFRHSVRNNPFCFSLMLPRTVIPLHSLPPGSASLHPGLQIYRRNAAGFVRVLLGGSKLLEYRFLFIALCSMPSALFPHHLLHKYFSQCFVIVVEMVASWNNLNLCAGLLKYLPYLLTLIASKENC